MRRPRRIVVEMPSLDREQEFLAAVRRSRALHRRWAAPPRTSPQYRDFLNRMRGPAHYAHFVCTADGSLAGVININDIGDGRRRSARLGYYAFEPHAGRGYMRAGLLRVLQVAFRTYGLHRLEVDIQPDNNRSIALVESLGFERRGRSALCVRLGGCWRDHERWALTSDACR